MLRKAKKSVLTLVLIALFVPALASAAPRSGNLASPGFLTRLWDEVVSWLVVVPGPREEAAPDGSLARASAASSLETGSTSTSPATGATDTTSTSSTTDQGPSIDPEG